MGSAARGPQGGRATASPARRPSRAAANRLMALSGAVIVAVYTAGYARTEAAAQQANAAMAALKASAGSAIPSGGNAIASALTAASAASTPASKPSSAAASSGGAAPASSSAAAPPAKQTPPASNPPAASSSAAAPPAASSSATAPPAASSSATAPPAASSSATATGYKSGSFAATGWGPHGPMQVTVVIKKGRIVSANVTACGTTYSCQYMQPLANLVVSTQQAPTEYVSGATASSLAYQQAVTSALAQA